MYVIKSKENEVISYHDDLLEALACFRKGKPMTRLFTSKGVLLATRVPAEKPGSKRKKG